MRLLVVVLSLLVASGVAELVYTYRGVEERIPLVQLWFEGHWAKVRKEPSLRELVFGPAKPPTPLSVDSLLTSFPVFCVLHMFVVATIQWNGDLEQAW